MSVLKHVIEVHAQTITIGRDALKKLYFEIGELLGYPSAPDNGALAPLQESQVPESKPTKTVDPRFAALMAAPTRVKAGETSRDYAAKAAKLFNEPVTARAVAAKMGELGWTCNAPDTRGILGNARTAMHEAGFVSVGNGL